MPGHFASLFYKFFALFSLLDFFSSFSPRFILFFALYLLL